MKRGQASFEYVILVGTLLVILIPLFYYAINQSTETIKLEQAEDTVYSLTKAADEIYSLGPGSKKYVWITIPGGVQSTQIVSTEIIMQISIFGETHRHTHVNGTLDALRALKPRFINIMTLNEDPKSRYKTIMDKEVEAGTNRRLTPEETTEQIADLIEGISFETTIGCFDNSMYLGRNTNRVRFRSVEIEPWFRENQKRLADRIRTAAHSDATEVSIAM